ncbi:MAG: hypothetical protein IT362_04675 [Deltaproteobacteria bacterium]|nr:hypothetical protein [Deltaproteobacteria bacterium]
MSVGEKDGNTGFAVGFRGVDLGIELGGINESDYSSSDIYDYPVPHTDFTDLGKQKVDSAIGLDVLGFYNASRQLSFYGGLGLYFQQYIRIGQSNISGLLYTEAEETEADAAFSAGIQFFPSNSVLLGIGYHSIRGINGQIGIKF